MALFKNRVLRDRRWSGSPAWLWDGSARPPRSAMSCPGSGFDFVPRSPLNVVQMPAKANSGRSSLSANHTTSFFLVSGLGSGAYSAKLLAGTRQRFSGFSHMRQCGDDVLRMLVTGGPPVRGGGGMPQRMVTISVPVSV